MESSQARALTIAQQLAALRLHRVDSETLGMRSLRERVERATMLGPGQAEATQDGREAALAWAMARAAQSCASLAAELQISAQTSSERTLALPESTCKQLLDSIVTFNLLLDAMHLRLCVDNMREDCGGISALSEHMAVVIRCMLDQDLAITTVEYMINIKSQGTSSTADAGDMR